VISEVGAEEDERVRVGVLLLDRLSIVVGVFRCNAVGIVGGTEMEGLEVGGAAAA